MMKEIKGICFLHSETGTEGGWWAMQEDGFVTEDGHWRYEGMQYLEEGDDFTVFANMEVFSGMASSTKTTKPAQFRTGSYAKAKSLPTIRISSRLSAGCGYIGFKKEWTRRLGASCSTVKSVAY
jgi:hypothetical protein